MNLSARSTIGEPGRSAKITVEAAANDIVVLRLNDKASHADYGLCEGSAPR